jgi:selenoprotein W-related protein
MYGGVDNRAEINQIRRCTSSRHRLRERVVGQGVGMKEVVATPRVSITYCTQCRWLLRAAWMAQELLNTFTVELGEVALVPGTGGVFRITVGDVVIWDRSADGGFPEVTTLKQRVRDEAAPDRDLGHADRPTSQ